MDALVPLVPFGQDVWSGVCVECGGGCSCAGVGVGDGWCGWWWVWMWAGVGIPVTVRICVGVLVVKERGLEVTLAVLNSPERYKCS